MRDADVEVVGRDGFGGGVAEVVDFGAGGVGGGDARRGGAEGALAGEAPV